jgi:hypothetical protein
MTSSIADSFVSKLCNENKDLIRQAGENCRHINERLPQLYKQTLDYHTLPHFIVSDLFLAAVRSGMYIERQSHSYYKPESSAGVYMDPPTTDNTRELQAKGSLTPAEDKLRLPSFYSRAVRTANKLEDPPNPDDIVAPTTHAQVLLSIGITFGELLESERPLVWGRYTEETTLKDVYLTQNDAKSSCDDQEVVMPVTVIDSPLEHPLTEDEFVTY